MPDSVTYPNMPAADDIATKSGLLKEYQDRGHPGAGPQEMFDQVFEAGLIKIGDLSVSDTATVAVALGMKRKDVSLSGVTASDRLIVIPNGLATAGCEVVNAYCSAKDVLTVAFFTPALGVGATFSIQITVYRIV